MAGLLFIISKQTLIDWNYHSFLSLNIYFKSPQIKIEMNWIWMNSD